MKQILSIALCASLFVTTTVIAQQHICYTGFNAVIVRTVKPVKSLLDDTPVTLSGKIRKSLVTKNTSLVIQQEAFKLKLIKKFLKEAIFKFQKTIL